MLFKYLLYNIQRNGVGSICCKTNHFKWHFWKGAGEELGLRGGGEAGSGGTIFPPLFPPQTNAIKIADVGPRDP